MVRIPDIEPRSIVDLGTGTGHLAARLAERWPEASVAGIDGSTEMIERARADHPSLGWSVGDIANWEPSHPVDLLFSNAALHWLDHHETLFPRLRSHLAPGGVLAVQMPDNWAEPTHRIPAEVLNDGGWPAPAREALLRDRLAPPTDYAAWVAPAAVDLWRTTYYQPLVGDDPVWTWVTGSLLRPVLAALGDAERERFTRICRARYADAYPAGPGDVTTLPFSRLFLIARAT
jgi:trans-aconitate 2-methyltransferase